LGSAQLLVTASRRWAAISNYVDPGLDHLLMYIAGRFQLVRRTVVALRRTKQAPAILIKGENSSLEALSIEDAVTSLERNGIAKGLRLRKETLKELLLFSEQAICFGNGDRKYPFLLNNRSQAQTDYQTVFTLGRYLGSSNTCRALKELTKDPTLLAIARGYLGREPALVGARMWWSFPSDADLSRQRSDGQEFHFDLEDYRAISFFFYLSDVDTQSGAHVFVRGSHRSKPLRFLLDPAKSKSADDIVCAYGHDQIETVSGLAGAGFAEDLFCYHKGSHPKERSRLLVQVRYGYKKYGKNREE
jgi:hypothetical protein